MYLELTKARLSILVLVTTAVGYVLGLPHGVNWLEATGATLASIIRGEFAEARSIMAIAFGTIDWLILLVTLIGAGLAAGGTSAINQWMEMDRDAAMERTRRRPLPSRAMSRNEAFLAGVLMIAAGGALLYAFVNVLGSFLTLLTATLYIVAYTPLKTRTTLNTLVGAVCGAIPPMIGWAAASGTLGLGAWLLAAILFIWQLPHFLGLAWMYRDDYARGGFRMLTIDDRDGELTARLIVLTSLLLLPLGLMLFLSLRLRPSESEHGWVFVAGSIALGGFLVVKGLRMYRRRDRRAARAVFLTSILYLPVVLALAALDQPRPPLRALMYQATTVASADEVVGRASPASTSASDMPQAEAGTARPTGASADEVVGRASPASTSAGDIRQAEAGTARPTGASADE